jgi:predicted RNA-binding Zn ribbon-like protein
MTIKQVTPADVMQGRPEPFFVAGMLGLDFLNSLATPVDVPVEWIASGDDLLNWMKMAAMIPADAAASLRRTSLPGELDAVAAHARVLREWFRGFVHAHRGKSLEPTVLDDLEPLNQLLARGQEFEQIVAGDGRLCMTRQRQWRSPDTLLLPIARALADLICDVDFAHVKGCEGHACTLLYMDRTKTGARRWCSMAVCGNRRKQAARRIRERKQRS